LDREKTAAVGRQSASACRFCGRFGRAIFGSIGAEKNREQTGALGTFWWELLISMANYFCSGPPANAQGSRAEARVFKTVKYTAVREDARLQPL